VLGRHFEVSAEVGICSQPTHTLGIRSMLRLQQNLSPACEVYLTASQRECHTSQHALSSLQRLSFPHSLLSLSLKNMICPPAVPQTVSHVPPARPIFTTSSTGDEGCMHSCAELCVPAYQWHPAIGIFCRDTLLRRSLRDLRSLRSLRRSTLRPRQCLRQRLTWRRMQGRMCQPTRGDQAMQVKLTICQSLRCCDRRLRCARRLSW